MFASRLWRALGLAAVVGAGCGMGIGGLLGTVFALSYDGLPWLGGSIGAFAAGLDYAILATLVFSTEILLPHTRAGAVLTRAPFLGGFLLKAVWYVCATLALTDPGRWLAACRT